MSKVTIEFRKRADGWRIYHPGYTTPEAVGPTPHEALARYVLKHKDTLGLNIQAEDDVNPFVPDSGGEVASA